MAYLKRHFDCKPCAQSFTFWYYRELWCEACMAELWRRVFRRWFHSRNGGRTWRASCLSRKRRRDRCAVSIPASMYYSLCVRDLSLLINTSIGIGIVNLTPHRQKTLKLYARRSGVLITSLLSSVQRLSCCAHTCYMYSVLRGFSYWIIHNCCLRVKVTSGATVCNKIF